MGKARESELAPGMMRTAALASAAFLLACDSAWAANSACDKAILAEVARAEAIMRADVKKSNEELLRLTDSKYSQERPKDLLARRIYARLLMEKLYKKPILEAQLPLAVYKKEVKKTRDSKVCKKLGKVTVILNLSIKQHKTLWARLMTQVRAFDPKRKAAQ